VSKVEFYTIGAGRKLGDASQVLGLAPDTITNVNVVAWNIRTGVLEPPDLAEVEAQVRELARALDTAKPVVLSGRAPLWLYALLVHELHYFPAVAVWDPRIRMGVVVEGPDDLIGRAVTLSGDFVEAKLPVEAKGAVSSRLIHADKLQLLHVEIVGDRFAEPRVLRDVLKEVKDMEVDGAKPLVIEGSMPVWLASFYAARLVHRVPALLVYDPRLGGVVSATHTPELKVGDVVPINLSELLKKEPVVIGVVGHPNSGKSVFLHLLNAELKRRGFTTLTQEGDLFAPTQEWSLHAPEVRRELKKQMSPEERLRWVVESLDGVKKAASVDFVLVDIGGGRPGERLVTMENLAILQRVDAVVVVSREGLEDWLRELELYVPKTKVVAVLHSKLRGTAKFDKDTRTGVVVGLDRELYAQGNVPEGTLKVVSEVAELIVSKKFIAPGRALEVLTASERGHRVEV